MLDVIVLAIVIGIIIFTWRWINNSLKARGKGAFLRHTLGSAGSFTAGAIALAVALPAADQDTTYSGGDAMTETAIEDDLSPEPANPTVDPARESPDITDLYSVNSDEELPPYKRTVEVTLYERINEETLEQIGRAIKADGQRNVERTFIGYRLEQQDPNTAYWATTHYNPELSVRVSGLTADQYDTYLNYDLSQDYDNVLGSWLVERGTNAVIVAFEKDGQIHIDNFYPGEGAFGHAYERQELENGGQRLQQADDEFGEYFVITADGDLQFWSDNGNYYTASPRIESAES